MIYVIATRPHSRNHPTFFYDGAAWTTDANRAKRYFQRHLPRVVPSRHRRRGMPVPLSRRELEYRSAHGNPIAVARPAEG